MMKKLLINIIAAAAMLVPLSLSAQDTRVQESRKAKLEKEKSSYAEIEAGKLVKSDIDELLAKKGIV